MSEDLSGSFNLALPVCPCMPACWLALPAKTATGVDASGSMALGV